MGTGDTGFWGPGNVNRGLGHDLGLLAPNLSGVVTDSLALAHLSGDYVPARPPL
jgi:hypothetical protein